MSEKREVPKEEKEMFGRNSKRNNNLGYWIRNNVSEIERKAERNKYPNTIIDRTLY